MDGNRSQEVVADLRAYFVKQVHIPGGLLKEVKEETKRGDRSDGKDEEEEAIEGEEAKEEAEEGEDEGE